MNEEEKQAIKILKSYKNPFDLGNRTRYGKSIQLIENLIIKQQKEIENYQILKDDIEGHRIAYVDTPEFEENYISKDKIRHIRDKAECMDYYSLNDVIDDLTKLIGDEKNDE